ncbi:uncharacterized protein LOC135467070 [Liolophura sinensis]|uniref:uncharacterized protein LOC135467070 n=1 Tax=Liolophura sinensis TaxID=3198878 RepID=UPI0031589E04
MTETAGKPVANAKMVNQYEEIRKRNIEDNRRILAELGILNPFKPLGKVVKKSVKRKRHSTGGEWVPKKQAVEVDQDYEGYGSIRGTCRRSSRIQGKAAPNAEELKDEVDRFVEEEQNSRLKVKPNRPNFYGAVEDVLVQS